MELWRWNERAPMKPWWPFVLFMKRVHVMGQDCTSWSPWGLVGPGDLLHPMSCVKSLLDWSISWPFWNFPGFFPVHRKGQRWVGGCSMMMSRTPVDSARPVGEIRFNFLWVSTCLANTIFPHDRGGGDFPVPLRLALTVWFTLLSGMSVDLTSAGALNAVDFCASVISQGVSDFSRLWNPREENWNLSPQTRAKQPETEPPSHPQTLSKNYACYTSQFWDGLLHSITSH